MNLNRTIRGLLSTLIPLTCLALASPAQRKAIPAAPANDQALAANIRARFAKSKINADHFQVRVENGVAIIEGKTAIIQRKGVATRLARLAGAKSIQNRIEISEAARAKAKANLQEGRRRAQVKRDERD
ncbi:MAG: BON domain-containing protein [Bryobacteraceae bacterium]